jgi:pectin methylesterase-like acyl-CoA thioesterase
VTPAHVVWVAKSGGNFTSVQAALASITTNSASQPYVIKIAPGAYVEAGGIAMKDHVDLEGSGTDNTTITCACAGPTTPFADGSSATVRIDGLFVTEVRDLTVQNTGSGVYSVGVWSAGAAYLSGVSLRDVNISAVGGDGNYGLWSQAAKIRMDGGTITATGSATSVESAGVGNMGGGTMILRNVTLIGDNGGATGYGADNEGGSFLKVTNSILEGTGNAVHAFQAYTYLSDSAVGGQMSGANFRCIGVYDVYSYASADALCPA